MINTRLLGQSLTALLLLVASFHAQAGIYVGGAVGLYDHGFEVDGDVGGYSVAVGYRPVNGGLGGEFTFLDAGSVFVSGLGNLEMNGTNASVVYWFRDPGDGASGMAGYVKLGVYNMSATVSPATASSRGWSAGMGFEFNIKPNLGFYTDLDWFALVDATNNRLDMLSAWNLGLRYHF